MDKQAVKEIASKHNLTSEDVYDFADELLSRVRAGQIQRYGYLAQELTRVIIMIKPHNEPNLITLQRAVNTLNGLIRGLTDPNLHKDIELVGIPKQSNDPINPIHYKTESGVQAIDIAELFPYSLGNAIKYAWRAGKKDNLKQDLEKCEWYLNRAMANGEDSLFMSYHASVLKARRLFVKLNKTDLPALNHELVSRILDGRLEYALTHIDDWLVGER